MTIDIKGLGKITASKDVLNVLAGMCLYASKGYEDRGMITMSIYSDECFITIYDELDKAGYYDK